MTFETAIGFLRSAALGGKTDNLESPSSCIVMGKPFAGGTGSFKVMQKLVMDTVKEEKLTGKMALFDFEEEEDDEVKEEDESEEDEE